MSRGRATWLGAIALGAAACAGAPTTRPRPARKARRFARALEIEQRKDPKAALDAYLSLVEDGANDPFGLAEVSAGSRRDRRRPRDQAGIDRLGEATAAWSIRWPALDQASSIGWRAQLRSRRRRSADRARLDRTRARDLRAPRGRRRRRGDVAQAVRGARARGRSSARWSTAAVAGVLLRDPARGRGRSPRATRASRRSSPRSRPSPRRRAARRSRRARRGERRARALRRRRRRDPPRGPSACSSRCDRTRPPSSSRAAPWSSRAAPISPKAR